MRQETSWLHWKVGINCNLNLCWLWRKNHLGIANSIPVAQTQVPCNECTSACLIDIMLPTIFVYKSFFRNKVFQAYSKFRSFPSLLFFCCYFGVFFITSQGPLVIRFVYGRTLYDVQEGEGVKSKAEHDVLCQCET